MTVKTSILVLAYCLGLALLLTLGGWQISRGLAKAAVLEVAETGSSNDREQHLTALPDNPDLLNYQTATIQGSWDKDRIILLANRIYQSQLGYEVIMPFRLNNDELILINRGWIRQGEEAALPVLQQQRPSGTLYLPKKGFTLGQAIQTNILHDDNWPKVSLYMDLEQFALALGQSISPLLMVLDADNENSLQRIWKAVVIQPERHYAYALQWFGLAIAFIIFGIIWFRRLKQRP